MLQAVLLELMAAVLLVLHLLAVGALLERQQVLLQKI
jgi:hypothetical protein